MEKIENFSFEYSLSKDDYLELWLFDLSQNKKFMKNRLKFKIIIYVLIIIIPIIFSIKYDFQWMFVIIWLITSFFLTYAIFRSSNSKLKNVFEKSIKEKYSSTFKYVYYLEFFETYIFHIANNSESKISYQDLNKFNETKNYFFIELISKNYLVLKKEKSIFEKIKSNLKIISKEYNIPYNEELNWKFK